MPSLLPKAHKKLSPEEVREALRLHYLWLEDNPEGRRADFSGVDLHGASFPYADLRRAGFRYANLDDADFHDSDLSRAEFAGASLHRANLFRASLFRTDFSSASLVDANLGGIIARCANFSETDLIRANLYYADCHHADFSSAILSDANFQEANLNGTVFKDAILSDANLLGVKLRDVVGNGSEIKSLQAHMFSVNWICAPDGATILQIGCQSHPLDRWRNATATWLDSMHPTAFEHWTRSGPQLLALVEASPAVPWGPPHAHTAGATSSTSAADATD